MNKTDINCSNCKAKLGRLLGTKIVLNGGSLIHGDNFEALLRCVCGEFANIEVDNGIIKLNGEQIKQTERSSNDSGNQPGRENDNSGQPNGTDSTGAGQGEGGTGTDAGNQPNEPESGSAGPIPGQIPSRPKSWIRK